MGQKHQTTLTCDLCGAEEVIDGTSAHRANWGNLERGRIYSTDETGLAHNDDTLSGLQDLCPICTDAVRRSDWAMLMRREMRREEGITQQ